MASLTGSKNGDMDTLIGCGEGGVVALGGALQETNPKSKTKKRICTFAQVMRDGKTKILLPAG
jgi:hypothetical protein